MRAKLEALKNKDGADGPKGDEEMVPEKPHVPAHLQQVKGVHFYKQQQIALCIIPN